MCILKNIRLNRQLNTLKDTPIDIIIYAGQSNAMGFGVGDEELSYCQDEDILMYYKGKIYVAKERYINSRDSRAIFALYFAKEYKKKYLKKGHKILLVATAVGGTGFSDHRWGIGEDLYNNLLRMTKKVIENLPNAKLKCLLWHQGEADIVNKVTSDYYKDKLRTLIDDYRRQTNSLDLPFIAGDYVPEWKDKEPYSQIISNATQDIVSDIRRAEYVSSEGLKGNPEPDEIHFCRSSIKILGERYFEKYSKIISDK